VTCHVVATEVNTRKQPLRRFSRTPVTCTSECPQQPAYPSASRDHSKATGRLYAGSGPSYAGSTHRGGVHRPRDRRSLRLLSTHGHPETTGSCSDSQASGQASGAQGGVMEGQSSSGLVASEPDSDCFNSMYVTASIVKMGSWSAIASFMDILKD
jgi:hypothetical protein